MRIKAVAAVVAITVASVLVPPMAHASHCWAGSFMVVMTPAPNLYIEFAHPQYEHQTPKLFVRIESDGTPGYKRGNRIWPVDPRDHGLPSPLPDPPCSTDDGDRVLFWAGIEDEG